MDEKINILILNLQRNNMAGYFKVIIINQEYGF